MYLEEIGRFLQKQNRDVKIKIDWLDIKIYNGYE